MSLLVLIVAPESRTRSEQAAVLRDAGHAVIVAASPGEVPLDLAPEWVLAEPTHAGPLQTRLGVAPRADLPAPDAQGRLWVLTQARVDLRGQRVFRPDGRCEALLDKEAALLGHLVARAGEVVSRAELLEQVWGYQATMQTRTVDNTVRRLRTRIEADASSPDHVQTVRGEGYRFVPLPGAPRPGPSPAAPRPRRSGGSPVLGCLRGLGPMAPYAWSVGNAWRLVRSAVFEPLVWLDSDGRLDRSLLEAIEVASDGRSARLVLQAGLALHPHPRLPDADASAADLRHSLELARQAGAWRVPLAGLEVAGPRTLELTFERPVGALVQRLSSVLLVPAALASVDDLDDLQQPIGTGPFRVVPDAGDGVVLEAHTAYWRSTPEHPLPRAPGLVVRTVGTSARRWPEAVEAVRAGLVHYFPLHVSESVDEVRAGAEAAGLRVAVHDAPFAHTLVALHWFPACPLSEADRRAIDVRLDRGPLVAGLPHLVPTDRLLPPAALGHELERPRPDVPRPSAARRLVLGLHSGLSPLADALCAALGELGVPARWVPLGDSTAREQAEAPTLDGTVLYWSAELWGRDPTPLLAALVQDSAAMGLATDELLSRLEAVESALTRRARRDALAALVRQLHHDAAIVPLGSRESFRSVRVIAPALRGLTDPLTDRMHADQLRDWSGLWLEDPDGR